MLVLTRTVNEAIEVSGPCRIVLLRAGHNWASIGVEAAPEVIIHREEVADAIWEKGYDPMMTRKTTHYKKRAAKESSQESTNGRQ